MSDRLEYYGEDGTHYVLEAIDDGAQLTSEQLTDVELPGLVLTQQMSRETLEAVLAMARELLGSADDRQPGHCPHCGGAIRIDSASLVFVKG